MMKAEEYFHLAPHNWNCAQALHKAWQAHTGLSDAEIELRYRPMGGGRAPEGMCGAIYAVRTLVGEDSPLAEELTRSFAERMGGLTCRELKGKYGRPCSALVATAAELLQAQCKEASKDNEYNKQIKCNIK